MSLKMGTREVNGIIIIDLSGQVTLGEASASLRDEVRDQTGHGFRKIVLNLANVTYIDSAGLGELTASFTSVKNWACSPALRRSIRATSAAITPSSRSRWIRLQHTDCETLTSSARTPSGMNPANTAMTTPQRIVF